MFCLFLHLVGFIAVEFVFLIGVIVVTEYMFRFDFI